MNSQRSKAIILSFVFISLIVAFVFLGSSYPTAQVTSRYQQELSKDGLNVSFEQQRQQQVAVIEREIQRLEEKKQALQVTSASTSFFTMDNKQKSSSIRYGVRMYNRSTGMYELPFSQVRTGILRASSLEGLERAVIALEFDHNPSQSLTTQTSSCSAFQEAMMQDIKRIRSFGGSQ